MAEPIDRQASMDAIAKLIKEEEEKIKKLEERRKERQKDGRDTEDLDKEIENERSKIAGKNEVGGKDGVIDQFGQMDAIDALIKKERDSLKELQDKVEQKRKSASIPRTEVQQDEIDQLDGDIRRLKHKIEGKEEAKGAVR